MNGTFENIHKYLPREEILAQLAEEASELAQAALKLRRVLDRSNPTPKSFFECMKNIEEEIADVHGCISALENSGLRLNWNLIEDIKIKKESRWEWRLLEQFEVES